MLFLVCEVPLYTYWASSSSRRPTIFSHTCGNASSARYLPTPRPLKQFNNFWHHPVHLSNSTTFDITQPISAVQQLLLPPSPLRQFSNFWYHPINFSNSTTFAHQFRSGVGVMGCESRGCMGLSRIRAPPPKGPTVGLFVGA